MKLFIIASNLIKFGIYVYVKLDEKTDSAGIFAQILVFLEKIMILSYLDMFTQFEFEITIFELKQIQIVF